MEYSPGFSITDYFSLFVLGYRKSYPNISGLPRNAKFTALMSRAISDDNIIICINIIPAPGASYSGAACPAIFIPGSGTFDFNIIIKYFNPFFIHSKSTNPYRMLPMTKYLVIRNYDRLTGPCISADTK